MNILKRLFHKKKSGHSTDSPSPEIIEKMIRSGNTVYVDYGVRRSLFGLLRMTGIKPRVYILDTQQERAAGRQLRELTANSDKEGLSGNKS